MNECYIIGGAAPNGFGFVNIDSSAFIIAADSGADLLDSFGVIPDIIIGDFDSCKDILNYSCDIITFPPEKDDTDLMLAAKKALELGFTRITLLGVTGGRLDHTFAAVQTLEYLCENGANSVILDDRNAVYIQGNGLKNYKREKECYISVLALTDKAVVSEKGVKYQIEKHTLSRYVPLGISNEFTEQSAEIEVFSGKILVIYSKK